MEKRMQIVVKANIFLNENTKDNVDKIKSIIEEIEKEHNGNCTLLEINFNEEY